MRQPYLVVSYDENQQHAFDDIVAAEDDNDAMRKVGWLRGDYADTVCAYTLEDVEEFATTLSEPLDRLETRWLDMLKAAGRCPACGADEADCSAGHQTGCCCDLARKED